MTDTTDIVQRLRQAATHELVSDAIALEAADTIEQQAARIAELEKDAARLDWWFSFDKAKQAAFVNQYLIGMREQWSPAKWRDAIDAAMERK